MTRAVVVALPAFAFIGCADFRRQAPSADPVEVAAEYFASLEDGRWADAADLLDPVFFRDSLQGTPGFNGRGIVEADPHESAAEYLERMDPRSWWLEALAQDAAAMPCYAERLRATFEDPPMTHRTVTGTVTVDGEWAAVEFDAEAHYPESPYHVRTPAELTRRRISEGVRLRRTSDGWRVHDRRVLQAGISGLNLDPDDACVREAYRRFYGDSLGGTPP